MNAVTNHKKIMFFAVLTVVIAGLAFFFWPRDTEIPLPDYSGWQTFTDPAQGATFRYPGRLPASYIHAVDWPPQLIVMNVPFTCNEAGEETVRAGGTKLEKINSREYCVTRVTEGAAGSVYTQYAYAFPKDGKQMILVFSLRKVQCGNYDEPQKEECEKEQETFDIGKIIDHIALSIQVG